MNQNICPIQNHNQRGIVSICFSTKCRGQRVCCQMCQNQLHKDHPDQFVDVEYLLKYIRIESQKPPILSLEVSQRLEELQKILNNLDNFSKLIRQEMQKLSSMKEQQMLSHIGNTYNILNGNFQGLNNQDWNQLAEDMLSIVSIKDCEIVQRDKTISQDIVMIQDKYREMKKHIDQILCNKEYFSNFYGPQLMQGHNNLVCGIDISQHRNLLASGSVDKSVKLWNLENHALINTFPHSGEVYDVVFSNSGNLLAFCGEGDYSMRVIDISDPLLRDNCVLQLSGHTQEIWRLKYSSDSKYLISGSSDCTVRIWDLDTKKESFQLNSESSVYGITINNDDTIIASNSDDGIIRIWTLKEKKQLCSLFAHSRGSDISFINDQNILVSSGYDGMIKLWNLQELNNQGKITLVRELKVANNCVWTVLFSTCSKFIISISYKDREIKVIDLQTGDVVKLFKLYTTSINYNTVDISISKDMKIIAYGEDKNIAVWRNLQ